MGSRLLRTNLLAPTTCEYLPKLSLMRVACSPHFTVQNTIDMRLDGVEEIVQSEDLYNAVKIALRAMNKVDVDKLITAASFSARGFGHDGLFVAAIDNHSDPRTRNQQSKRSLESRHDSPQSQKRRSLHSCCPSRTWWCRVQDIGTRSESPQRSEAGRG